MAAAVSSSRAARRRWWGAALVLLAVGAGAWLLAGRDRHDAAPSSPITPPAIAAAQAPRAAAAPQPTARAAVAAEASPAIPAGLSADQYQQLRDSLAGHPQQEAEVARVVAYLQFANQWQQFQQRRAAGAPPSELQPLARALDAALDVRLQQREMAAAEAMQVKAALLDVLQPDASTHAAALRDWRERIAAAAPPAVADTPTAAFERRQAEIVAAWRALPPAQRDEKRLEAELEALRRTMFPANPQGGPR